jgi:hypothetical protein
MELVKTVKSRDKRRALISLRPMQYYAEFGKKQKFKAVRSASAGDFPVYNRNITIKIPVKAGRNYLNPALAALSLLLEKK